MIKTIIYASKFQELIWFTLKSILAIYQSSQKDNKKSMLVIGSSYRIKPVSLVNFGINLYEHKTLFKTHAITWQHTQDIFCA